MMRVTVGSNMKQSIEHELVHWAQAFLKIALESEFGLPSKKIRTPEVDQDMETSVRRMTRWTDKQMALFKELKRKGIRPDQFHDLDDVEFFAELNGAYERLEQALANSVDNLHERELFDKFVQEDKFLGALKAGSRGKWQRAVKELARVLL